MFFLHYFLIRRLIKVVIFPGTNFIANRIHSLKLGISSAKNFAHQISELKRVANDFISKERHKPMSLIDLDSRLFIIHNAMDSIVSYLRISNSISQNYKLSKYQERMTLNLHILKQTIEESRLVRLIESSIRDIEKGNNRDIRNSKLDLNIKKLISNIEKIEETLDEFLMNGGFFSKLKNWLFNDTFGSLYQFKIELINRFNCEQVKILTQDKLKIDGLLIRARESRPSSRSNSSEIEISNPETEKINPIEKGVMIICGPNAVSYEVFAFSDRWLEFYLDYGVSVFLWNYRGFGESEGLADFNNLKTDSISVCEYLRTNYKFSKIGVHGISIGGIPACHLASYITLFICRQNLVSLCFTDRTFSCIPDIIKSFKLGYLLKCLFSVLIFPSSDNVENFVISSAVKILSSDPNDTIIPDSASLKTGISLYHIKTKISKNEDLLKFILEKDCKEFCQSLITIIQSILKSKEKQRKFSNHQYDNLNEDSNTGNTEIVLTDENNPRVRDQKRVLQSVKII